VFIAKSDICNFAYENSLYSCQDTLDKVISNLKFDLAHVFKWFSVPVEINVGSLKLRSTNLAELLGVKIDSNLSFCKHITAVCEKSKLRVWSLNRIRSYLSWNQCKLLFNVYIMSMFNYAPITWMFCNKTSSQMCFEGCLF